MAECSSRNCDNALATGLLSPMTSTRNGVIEFPVLYWIDSISNNPRTSLLSSLVLLIASPVHEGIVGRNPVAGVTFTLVPITLATLYVDPPRRKTSPFLILETNEEESCPTRVPSEVNTR